MKTLVALIILSSINITLSNTNEVKLSLSENSSENSSDIFVATHEWQEIKPGQRVKQGLHYRLNLQTGVKEAKILETENENTSLVNVDKPEEDSESDVEKNARQRIKDALKNIPADKFPDMPDEKWKEITKKFKTYEQIKMELKDIDLEVKTEAQIIKELVDRYLKLPNDDNARDTILEDIEYLVHSIDNALEFINVSGLEKLIIPNLVNQTNVQIKVKSLKALGALLQNNAEAKKYTIEKTNIGNYLINLMTRFTSQDELSSALFSYGSLMRNNAKASLQLIKKGMPILIAIISDEKSEISLSIKTKAFVLLDDLLQSLRENTDETLKIINNLKFCQNLANYFNLNRNGFLVDIDLSERAIKSLINNRHTCVENWSESPKFRHTLLVLLNNFKSRVELVEDDSEFMNTEVVTLLEEFHSFLYSHLNISEDDLSKKYRNRVSDEL